MSALLTPSDHPQNIPNVYSFALTVQSFHKSLQRIPRFSLCILCTIICSSRLPFVLRIASDVLTSSFCTTDIVLAEAGYDSFETAFDTLLVILSCESFLCFRLPFAPALTDLSLYAQTGSPSTRASCWKSTTSSARPRSKITTSSGTTRTTTCPSDGPPHSQRAVVLLER